MKAPRIAVVAGRLRIVPSSLCADPALAYTLRELPRDGSARVFEYQYLDVWLIAQPPCDAPDQVGA